LLFCWIILKFILHCYRWAACRENIDEIKEAVQDMSKDKNVNLRIHFGGAVYVSVKSGFLCVDFRKFYQPYDAQSDDIKPTRKAVSLRLDEWANLLHASYTSLESVQPCYVADDHMNQIGWLECLECNPRLNQHRQKPTTPATETSLETNGDCAQH